MAQSREGHFKTYSTCSSFTSTPSCDSRLKFSRTARLITNLLHYLGVHLVALLAPHLSLEHGIFHNTSIRTLDTRATTLHRLRSHAFIP